MEPTPRCAIRLTRISDARDEDTKGVDAQGKDCDGRAERGGWTIGPAATHHIVENDTSAFKRKKILLPDGRRELRTVRPGFRQTLAMLADGRADGLIAYDLDRAVRDPRDLEDLIDVVESRVPRIPVESVTGSLRLANDAEVTMARVMVAVANKSSRDTARRVSRARQRQAEEGQWGGGKRPFGFEPDGVTVNPVEAAEIRRAADAILAGVSLRQVTASLRERKVPTVKGAKWSTVTVRDMLLRPRNAALMVYRANGGRGPRAGRLYTDGDITGKAPWDEIIPEEAWRAVRSILTDPARRIGPGNTPRWLGSRIYRCGVCGDGATLVTSGSTSNGHRYFRYTCREYGHLARAAVPCDEYVEVNVTDRLALPDAADLLIPPAGGGNTAADLRREVSALRELLNEQARLHARGVIDGQQLAAGSEELRSRLGAAEGKLSAMETTSPLAGIAGQPDAAAIWRGLDLGRKRAILRAAVTVTLFPVPADRRRGRHFDHDSVDIDWKQLCLVATLRRFHTLPGEGGNSTRAVRDLDRGITARTRCTHGLNERQSVGRRPVGFRPEIRFIVRPCDRVADRFHAVDQTCHVVG
jgi:site-specific DNA recombinase